jgi:hypothetical protein
MTGTQLLLVAGALIAGFIGAMLALLGGSWWEGRSQPPPEPVPPTAEPATAPRTAAPPPPTEAALYTPAAIPAPSSPNAPAITPPATADVARSKARGRELIQQGRVEEGIFYFQQAQRLAAEEIEHVIAQSFPKGAPVGTGPILQRLLNRLDELPVSQQLLSGDDPLLDGDPDDGVRGRVALRLRSLAGEATAQRARPADLTTLLRAVADYSLTVATQEEIHEALLERELQSAGRRLEGYLEGAGLDGQPR